VTEIAKKISDEEAAHPSNGHDSNPVQEKAGPQIKEKSVPQVQETTADASAAAAKDEGRTANEKEDYDGIEHAENKI